MKHFFLASLKHNNGLHKLARFFASGGVIWALRALLTALLKEKFNVDVIIAYRVGLVISFFLYFFINLYFTFLVKDRIRTRLIKYSFVSVCFLATDGLLMEWVHHQWNWHYLLALSFSTGVLLGVKFLVYNSFVFRATNPNASLTTSFFTKTNARFSEKKIKE